MSKVVMATVTSKGQVTIPSEVRIRMAIKPGDEVEFMIRDDGRVELQKPKYSSVASISGVAGSLGKALSKDEMLQIAREEVADRRLKGR